MNKQIREVTKADLIPAEEYAKNRKAYSVLLILYFCEYFARNSQTKLAKQNAR